MLTLEVVCGSPWRGTVRITGILEVAQHFERGAPCRRGFRVGETLEVGHSSIEPTEDPGQADYLVALQQARDHAVERTVTGPTGPHHWIHAAMASALSKALAAELRRLNGQPWRLGTEMGHTTAAAPGAEN